MPFKKLSAALVQVIRFMIFKFGSFANYLAVFFGFMGMLVLGGCQTQSNTQNLSLAKVSNASVAPANDTVLVKPDPMASEASNALALAKDEGEAASTTTALAIVGDDGQNYQALPQQVPSPKLVKRSRNVAAIEPDSPLFGSKKSEIKQLRGPVKPSRVRVARLTKKPNFFERIKLRRQKYAAIVAKHARAHGVPLKLAMAVVQVESSFRAKAKGLAGEIGLMQIRPQTARGMGYKGSIKALYKPDTNIRYGMKYLGEAHRRGGGKVCGTILKYNAGHYAKRRNRVSDRYCRRVKRIMGTRGA